MGPSGREGADVSTSEVLRLEVRELSLDRLGLLGSKLATGNGRGNVALEIKLPQARGHLGWTSSFMQELRVGVGGLDQHCLPADAGSFSRPSILAWPRA